MILGGDYVFTLSDNQYWAGHWTSSRKSYDATWDLKSVTFPTPGDHEYHSETLSGYYTYFGVPPYYSFDIGAWHWVSPSIPRSPMTRRRRSRSGCGATSRHPQPVSAPSGACRRSPREGATIRAIRPFWDALYGVRADLVLGGDSHQYERFTKMAPDGAPAGDGIRQFVVGTGGRSLDGFSDIKPTSEALPRSSASSNCGWGRATTAGTSRPNRAAPLQAPGTAACN